MPPSPFLFSTHLSPFPITQLPLQYPLIAFPSSSHHKPSPSIISYFPRALYSLPFSSSDFPLSNHLHLDLVTPSAPSYLYHNTLNSALPCTSPPSFSTSPRLVSSLVSSSSSRVSSSHPSSLSFLSFTSMFLCSPSFPSTSPAVLSLPSVVFPYCVSLSPLLSFPLVVLPSFHFYHATNTPIHISCLFYHPPASYIYSLR